MEHTLEAGVEPPTGEDHPVSRIRTDIFCRQCGANLYEQPVWRTAEAGLLVVRCARCGVIASANEALPYRRIWRQRLGLVLALGWLLTLGLALMLLVAAEFGLQGESTAMRFPMYRNPYIRYPSPSPTALRLDWPDTTENLLFTVPGSLLVAFAGGCLMACAMYHWPLWGHVLAAPLFPAAAVLLLFVDRGDRVHWAGWTATGALHVALAVAAVQLLGGLAGAIAGRPVARGLLRLLLPSRSRQFFAFLWRRDGKEMPVGPF